MNVTIIGASGGIGNAVVNLLSEQDSIEHILACGRSEISHKAPKVEHHPIDLTDEDAIEKAAKRAAEIGPQDLVFVTSGFLHNGDIHPEKAIRDLSIKGFEQNFAINTIGPAMVAKHFLPIMRKNERSVFACLSARVGSISDNGLGGWYAYRASKAALNMVLKNLSIEAARRYKQMIILGLHPGTVDSALSKPFQGNVKESKLFTPHYSAERLLDVIQNAKIENSGDIIAWDGQRIEY
ncbi:MAG: SDR family NAD(P)-dependent oxidoreductase [Rhizobiaceae bacterium]|nr:SDR family NAD(P)-dependent oxidoreductase [Rhizobiaceae bacterium]